MDDESTMTRLPFKGEYILLHSGYGGGQYVGKVLGVASSDTPDNYLPVLILDSETMRFQPKCSNFGRHSKDKWIKLPYVRFGQNDHHIHLKPRDNLYAMTGQPNLVPFIAKNVPVDPTDQETAILFTRGSTLLEHLFGN